ncbi:PWI domain-containing protein isoform 5 [Cladophialophora immunda]|nr:PWI domain-containing protein isoform 5 [Cladophialophora immunda]
MYNPPYQASGQYGAPGDYANFPGAPPGMGPPPGMAPPGMGAPPGMQQQEAHQPGRPGSFPPNFQPPPNMPNINFSAPVIRLGTSGPSKPDAAGGREDRERGGRRPGLGAGASSDFRGERDRITQIQPPTKEEIIKTIYVGGITEGAGGDEGIERILNAAGSLRRWVRATDADGKPCKFGFAEYEDPESLSTAIEVLRDIEVPVKRQTPAEAKANEDVEIEMSKLVVRQIKASLDTVILTWVQVVADDNSRSYIEQWQESQGGKDTDQVEMRLDHARSALDAVLNDLRKPAVPAQKDEMSNIDREGDVNMMDGTQTDGATGEVVTIPIAIDDELSDIPAEMRETVAKEIAAFRDRSNRRDLERMKREEEIEQQERTRMMNGDRFNRLASPPPSAPAGPAGTNGIPVGPRGAPAGPKGFGVQIPREYQKGVVLVNGTAINGASAFEDEDTDASDEELERRRKEKRDAELEKQFLDQERRWLNRERSRTEAVERVKKREKDEAGRVEEEKEAMRKRLHDWNDDTEASRKTEEYYADRSIWIRNRASFRQREIANDDADRAAEQRERARELHQRERVDAMTDDFLIRQERDMLNKEQDREEEERAQASRREPARFKLSLGAAAQKAAAQSASQVSKRTVADVEGLLEDEEEESKAGTRRTLIPIEYDASTTAGMSEEERAQAARQLAADIPNDKEGLWAWDIKWEFVDESIIEERLKPFVEKKIVEYLGVQEQMLVDVVVNALTSRGKPQDLVGELEGALDEEAEVLVRKLWRMLIFFSESEKRGLAA